jgi:ribose transport system ATP-binding protein
VTAATDTPLLALDDVSKRFGGVQALRGARLHIYPGEVHTLLGENGAGKSTLVKVIAGVHSADAGEIHWDGERVDALDQAESSRLGIRVIHQRLNTVAHLSVSENITLGRERRRFGIVIRQKADRAAAAAALARVGARIELGRQAGGLPVAERQLIEIARALQDQDVRVLIMDEPTASLGEREVDRLFDVIRGLREAGVAIVFISHKLNEVMAISDRITVMRDGRWIATVLPHETSQEDLVEKMVGRQLSADVSALEPPEDYGEVVFEAERLTTRTGLKDVSVTLHRGEILGVYGLMGSGRTELARALVGADPLLEGTLRLDGREIAPRTPRAAKALGIGLVPEERSQSVFDLLSVRENLSAASSDLIASKAGVLRSGRERKRAVEAVRQLGVRTPSAEERMANLSGGNQQKVVLGRWLTRDTRVLLLDDPTSGVDVGAKAEIYRLISDIASAGGSVFMTSSELPELLLVAHRILVLHQGRVAGVLTGDARTERKVLHLALRGEHAADDPIAP